MVSIVESLLSTLHASANSILHCEANSALVMWAASLFSSRAAALVSRISHLCRSPLACMCTPLTKSEENERLLTV